jgi:hypothetical protein
MSKQTCKELIESQLADREKHLGYLLDIVGNLEEIVDVREAAQEELDDLPLSISEHKVYKILLSTGGPADWVEVRVDEYGYGAKMTYHYADWFDHAEIEISDKSYMAEYISNILEAQE